MAAFDFDAFLEQDVVDIQDLTEETSDAEGDDADDGTEESGGNILDTIGRMRANLGNESHGVDSGDDKEDTEESGGNILDAIRRFRANLGDESPDMESSDDKEDNEETGGNILDAIRRMHATLGEGSHSLFSIGDEEDDIDEDGMEADDYHNKAVDLARKNKYRQAAELCVSGLTKFPKNVDLLSDAIKYYSNVGDRDNAAKYYDMLNGIPRSAWNWRAYTFSLDYLMENAEENEEVCRAIIADYHKYLPHEEKAYVAESELEGKLGNAERSMLILVDAIKSMNNAPQISLRLADMQLERGLFEEAVKTVNYAMMASCEAQPSINVPYLMYVRCLAEDAVLHKKVYENVGVTAEDVDFVRGQYELLGKEFPAVRLRFESNISDRLSLLKFVPVT